MNGMPLPDERMEEFKYLAFLSYTAKHGRKIFKNKKARIILIIIIAAIVAAIVFFYAFYRPFAENPQIRVISGSENNAVLETDRKAFNEIAARYDVHPTFSILKSSNAVKVAIPFNPNKNPNILISGVINTILANGDTKRITMIPFDNDVCYEMCGASLIKGKNGTYRLKIVSVELPHNAGISGLLVFPEGILTSETIKKPVKNPFSVRLNKISSLSDISKILLYEDEKPLSKNTIYVYDMPEITIKACKLKNIMVNFYASISKADFEKHFATDNGSFGARGILIRLINFEP